MEQTFLDELQLKHKKKLVNIGYKDHLKRQIDTNEIENK